MADQDVLCPCGSGILYKECCGKTPKVVSLTQVRLRKVSQGLRHKLGDFANKYEFMRDAERAQELYFRELDASITDYDEDFLMERCFEWFIFDFILPDGERVIDKFIEQSDLSSDEKNLIEEWRKAPNSLFEVKSIYPEKGLILEDLLLGDRLAVMDSNAVKELDTGYILYMRVLTVGSENEFSTSGLALPGIYKDILLKKLFADADWYWEQGNLKRDWHTYLRDRSHVVNNIVMQVSIDPGLELRKWEQSLYREEDYREDGEEAELMAPEDFPWREPEYKNVARALVAELYNFSYDYRHMTNALKLWYDYSSLERPSFRKPEVWIAAILYVIFKLEEDFRENQHTLADLYGVSPSTISNKYRSVCKVLGLERCDSRYSTCGIDAEKIQKNSNNTVSILSHLLSKKE